MSSIHLREFEYYEPTAVTEVAKLLDEYGEDAQIMAGGIDLIPRIRNGSIEADCVINIQNIAELKTLEYDADKGLAFGAMTTLHALDTCRQLKEHFPIVQYAIHQITLVQSKYMGTAVGNLCVATPASDVAPVLMAHDADMLIHGLNGTRNVKVSDFYTGYHKTVLQRDEFVTGVFIPKPLKRSGETFLNQVRTHADIAKITVAVVVSVEDNICRERELAWARLLDGDSGQDRRGRPSRSRGRQGFNSEGGQAAMNDATPITDFRSTREYRLDMTRVLVGRALEEAFDRARGVDHV